MPVIETFELSRQFGDRIAVDNLNISVNAGEIVGLLGPNGAGKTTTIRMLAGMIAPTKGYAVVSGHRTDRNVEKLHETIGLLTETQGFYARLSARRNLEYFANFYQNVNPKIQVEKYLKITGLWDRRNDRVGTFSKGMKQRLALARALLHEPQVIFLDEPTSGLDPEAAGEIRQIIRSLRQAGRTIFLCTHNLYEAELICNRVAVINTRLLALDTVEQLRKRFFRHQIIIRLENLSDGLVSTVKSLPFVKEMLQENDTLILQLNNPENDRTELIRKIIEAGGRVVTVTDRQYPLEDIYLKLVREESGHGP